MEGLALSGQDIRAAFRSLLRGDASPSFLKRVREAAFVRVTTDNYNIVSRLPHYIKALNGLGHKEKVVTKRLQEMLDITMHIARE